MKARQWLLAASAILEVAISKELWSSKPATYAPMRDSGYLLKTGYPVGNGKLGAIPFGPPGQEKINLNVDSLWSGGPFEVNGYTGGNPSSPKFQSLPEIRDQIFSNGTGDMSALLGNGSYYGANRVLGNLTIQFNGFDEFSDYRRSLDIATGIHKTSFTSVSGANNISSSVFCSYPDLVCVYHLEGSVKLPAITIGVENLLVDQSLVQSTCKDELLLHVGRTQAGPPVGMEYAAALRADGNSGAVTCLKDGRLKIKPKGKRITIIWAAETNYDRKNGNKEARWTFKGPDPIPIVEKASKAAAIKGYSKLIKAHVKDFEKLVGAFTLDIPDTQGSKNSETAGLIQAYKYDGPGDPYLESLLFDLSRYLLITSSRDNSLPANLQGRWTEQLNPSWSADYHANINLQMNYWVADQTGLAATQKALWDYMADTWVPRGSETAKLLYNAPGWVVHNEMNIFGFTAMKGDAGWANYPVAPAWMMQHVWDAFDYTQDRGWLASQGYPLLKGVAEFWISQLQEDAYFEDGTLVVNPCNSAEHGPTTFGCVHYQQLIHQVLDSTLIAADIVSETDSGFIKEVSSSLKSLDKGLHFASWGGLKEWKMPEKLGYDEPSTHRHLSHLNGWYPGYSISSFTNGYVNATIQDAVKETLISRGMGNAEDANAGWAKVWRSACWARLNDTEKAYDHLRYVIEQNFVGNGFSMYSGKNPPFQIDANFGFGGAVLSMLVVDLPLPHGSKGQRTVVLGPAIPTSWGSGSVRGLRIRGGGVVDFKWDKNGLVTQAKVRSKSRGKKVRIVNVKGTRLIGL
ncbi:hypothetical protein FDECE_13079 [Fusarium decemcellulare]|nr:hypothetical protein FDECE_13079 [Fusarium decemcellulare]